ncbi:hypothetical protein [Kribbella pratensis]|uniref:Uncharacterized protein n=1 Tax=Kribbella pratensis TaxID=2512112 RepID=A0A4R8CM28_9ACTN|nr:hypothetical protein [Kribbella pratensis]TDW77126.1 hypothetical protein EV653_2290 [Kribbella pratensis]
MTPNLFTPPEYDEALCRLAIGVELVDALDALPTYGGGRYQRNAAVLDERHPSPLHQWRRWAAGQTLNDVLAGLDRHRSGRFAHLYGTAPDPHDENLTVRIVEPRASTGRYLVPRRLRLRLYDDPVPDPPPDPGNQRIFRVGMFPGAGAYPSSGSTVLRGRVVRPGADGELHPVRWVRVVARDTLDDLGWAHGDDRGEFVLILGSPAGAGTMPVDPLPVELTLTLPPAVTADPADVLLKVVDPLWDLPVQTAIATDDPSTDPVLTGRGPWPGTPFGPFAAPVPLGRESTVTIQLPA